ncbi:hypothetical protein THAOC_31862, partial [Thalassiosira oceanica]
PRQVVGGVVEVNLDCAATAPGPVPRETRRDVLEHRERRDEDRREDRREAPLVEEQPRGGGPDRLPGYPRHEQAVPEVDRGGHEARADDPESDRARPVVAVGVAVVVGPAFSSPADGLVGLLRGPPRTSPPVYPLAEEVPPRRYEAGRDRLGHYRMGVELGGVPEEGLRQEARHGRTSCRLLALPETC